MARTATGTVNWAVDVASRLKGAQFPIGEEEARNRLDGLTAKGRDINEVLDKLEFPIETPAALLHEISNNLD